MVLYCIKLDHLLQRQVSVFPLYDIFRIGPSGTALCVYRADNTGNQGLNKGIFEVFREDLVRVNPDGTTRATENNYVQVCINILIHKIFRCTKPVYITNVLTQGRGWAHRAHIYYESIPL